MGRGLKRAPGLINTGLRPVNGNLGKGVIGVARNPSNGDGEKRLKRLNGPPEIPNPKLSDGKNPGKPPPNDENAHGTGEPNCAWFADISARHASARLRQ